MESTPPNRPPTDSIDRLHRLHRNKNSPSSINLINSLPIPQIPLDGIPQLPSFIPRPTAIHHNDDILQPTGNVFVPVPAEAEVDCLGVRAAVPRYQESSSDQRRGRRKRRRGGGGNVHTEQNRILRPSRIVHLGRPYFFHV